ncbi:MAG: hypothetical protein COU51_02800 [Parcubacteria group bacterium CG10_big_fil_rev_8_21_14_0_10_36_14]|nr:MAG: hypothetical protein COU51_02800 [Parcubacteria group bacterium CG10_big_fil_rev_8_21_14_0_10_36_14]
MGELFKKIKKIAKEEGKAIVIDEATGDAFVIAPLEESKASVCRCEDKKEDTFSFEETVKENSFDDAELMRKVNDDISKWREEQQEKQNKEDIQDKNEKNTLNEEERYYLEPLE